jgi:hypothetical protein
MSNIEIYILGSFCVSSMMMWWFNTNLPIHIVQILKKAGLKKNDKEFWEADTPIHLWTQMDFTHWKMRSLPAWLDELTSCPGCLSMHLSFWTSLLITSLTYHGYESLTLFLLAWLGWPYISNVALAFLKKLNKH